MAALRLLPYAGWPLAAFMFWLWLGARDDLAAQVSACNASKLSSVAQASELARQAERESNAVRIAELAQEAENERNARRIAEEARERAEGAPEKVRTVYQRIVDEDSCAGVEYPAVLLNCVRNREDCGETSSRHDDQD